MIKLSRLLLLENPDTIKYQDRNYNYRDKANRSAFVVYNDKISGKEEYFGYDRDQKRFYSSNSEVVPEVENLKKVPASESYVARTIEHIENSNTGGGHSVIWSVIEELQRDMGWPENRGRVFVVPDQSKEGGTATIMSFWYSQEKAAKYKDTWNRICGELKLDPLTIIYNPGTRYLTHDEFYNVEKKPETPPVNPYGSPTVASMMEPVRDDLADMMKEKEAEYAQKSGDLHVRGATLTPSQKSQLKREVDSLAAEIEWLEVAIKLYKSLNIRINRDHALIVQGLKAAIERALEKKDHDQPYNLNAELEKQFPGMTIAQIRQRFSKLGVPLRKLVKEVLRDVVGRNRK